MSEESRPDPEALLAIARRENATQTHGRLKIFLGMCPGVGKTYAMLLDAQQRQEAGLDVVVGVVETHGRVETTALTTGLARVSRKRIEHRGVVIEEMDVDAILARKPRLVLVDELAHTNAPGSRHPKRYQDVIELIEAGVDVYTTLNVQHVESHRDVVTQITGAPVHETVPDTMLDRADEVELIDISPEQLRKRLEEGKVYLGERAAAATGNFFREGNLKALREIALRLSAERADRDLRDFMSSRRMAGPWKSRERLLVAVGPSPYSERLIRWTRRMAAATNGTWLAIYVDTGRVLEDDEKNRLEQNLSLARSLGAEVFSIAGENVTEVLLNAARQRNASQIVVGKPLTPPVLDFLRGGSLVDKLIRHSGDIDVYVVRAEKSAPPWRPGFRELRREGLLREFLGAFFGVCAVTLLGMMVRGSVGYMAVGLLYLLSVLLASLFLSRWPILFFATLTALVWNYLFIEPFFTFHIESPHDLILFAMYFVVALVLGQLNARLRQREHAERRREEQAVALYEFSRDITASRTLGEALQAGLKRINDLSQVTATILIPDSAGKLQPTAGAPVSDHEQAVAAWAYEKKQPAGRYTNTLPQSEGYYLPLHASNAVVGVLGVKTLSAPTLPERQMIETFAAQIALLIERDNLQAQAEHLRIEEGSRHLQKTLLDSVSHEFKTPLSVISSAVESLPSLAEPQQTLIGEIRVAADRLHRIVANLLDITRIETGSVRPKLDWCDLCEVIETANERSRTEIGSRVIEVNIAEDASACRVDAALLEEMLCNLLRNAAQHSPDTSTITVQAERQGKGVILRVQDEGSGLSEEEATRIFEKFHRGRGAKAGGLGLGLSIVRGFAAALGGQVQARARRDGKPGSEFEIQLPIEAGSAVTMTT